MLTHSASNALPLAYTHSHTLTYLVVTPGVVIHTVYSQPP